MKDLNYTIFLTMSIDLTLVLPCFNEEDNIIHLYDEFCQIPFSNTVPELILVNNGSYDKTEKKIDDLIKLNKSKNNNIELKKITLKNNEGYGGVQAPVVTTAEGKGAISDHHPLSLGALWLRNDTIARKEFGHDVILAVGTRLVTSQWLDGQKVVQIDIDPEEIGRGYENTMRVEGDAKMTMENLLTALAAKTSAKEDNSAAINAQKTQRDNDIIKVEPQKELLEAVRKGMPEDGILISGMTQLGYYSRAHFPVYEPRTFITSSYSGNLGYAYPTALGAKVAQPDKAVVCLSGDGGFMFNSQEMSTAVAHNINVVVVVFNDNAYGNVKRDQMNQFSGRTIGVELHNPDFVKLAEAYGAVGFVANGPDELEATLKKALTLDSPVLIEVPVGPMPSPFFKNP